MIVVMIHCVNVNKQGLIYMVSFWMMLFLSLCIPFLLLCRFRVQVYMPEWTKSYVEQFNGKEFSTDEEMMRVAVDLSKHNVIQNTGGPFGCAIFETDKSTGKSKLFSIGVNRVTTLNNSTLHGEMIAIQFAQKKLKNFALKDKTGSKEYCLFTSCEPCAMCKYYVLFFI